MLSLFSLKLSLMATSTVYYTVVDLFCNFVVGTVPAYLQELGVPVREVGLRSIGRSRENRGQVLIL